MFTQIPINFSREELFKDYTQDSHYYKTKTNKRFMSVTTMFKLLSDDSWLPRWHESIARKEKITIKQAQQKAMKISEESISVGNDLHEMAHNYLINKPIKNNNKSDTFTLMANNLKQFLNDNVNNIKASEVKLYDPKIELAGMVDCIADYKGSPHIIDFKNSRKPKSKYDCNSRNYFTQLAAYGKMWEYCTNEKIIAGAVIVISWDGKVTPYEVKLADYEYDLLKKLVQIEMINI